MSKLISLSLLIAFTLIGCKSEPPFLASPDDLDKAYEILATQRQEALQQANAESSASAEAIEKLLDLGLWQDAEVRLANADDSPEMQMVRAKYAWLKNDFFETERLTNDVLATEPDNFKANLMKSVLEVEAWELEKAAETAKNLADKSRGDEEIAAMLQYGRVLIWQKRYDEALEIAKTYQKEDPSNSKAYLLEADVYFWNQKPAEAEAPLVKSLEINPLVPDARFSYGYAIWRRVDAEQLKDMAAQWALALEINPLHYYTHWHWGNGHTQLTYADYAEDDDEEIREKLKAADDLARENKPKEAIAYTFEVESEYPNSVIPLLHRASLYYVSYDMDRQTRLDSAQMLFEKILNRKTNFGPAHNGLSAVIKSKRIPYLAAYDSIDNALRTMEISDPENFARVFPDVTYYPGDMVKSMVWGQLYTSIVYFPFLSKLDRQFIIPPLHLDLATTMNRPSFRFQTTFDNRQWMDIRGVGSGAAAIEYVERGAFMERNVVLHEYVHLFHGQILTDAEAREVRQRYFTAMKEDRTLDYYSANNESEYLAQTYPAYFEPVKVHPLDFKSMNTTNDLKTKDPEMYAFLDKMINKEKAYLAGDKQAMASNWAEVYVKLSGNNRANTKLSQAYLDTALIWDKEYLPAYLSYSNLMAGTENFDAAKTWLEKAEAIDANYAPIYATWARYYNSLEQAGQMTKDEAVSEQIAQLEKSISLENDFLINAGLNSQLRSLLLENSRIPAAIQTAESYVSSAETISTYLRDRRDDAQMFAWYNKALLGYADVLDGMDEMVRKKPQNYSFRTMYADALAANKQYDKALSVLEEAQRILAAVGTPRADFSLRMAEYYLAQNKQTEAMQILDEKLEEKPSMRGDMVRLARVLALAGETERAESTLQNSRTQNTPYTQADLAYTKAVIAMQNADNAAAQAELEKAVTLNPYHFDAWQMIKEIKGELSETERQTLDALELKAGSSYTL
ncbi:hypothetical protein ACFCT7_13220 [Fulvivirgaceae bacterium LMO-SS25]